MAKRSRKRSVGTNHEYELSGKKGAGKPLEEIIQESLNPDCNLILLDGKIRELEKSGRGYIPLLIKRFKQGKASEQKVILDLLGRKKSQDIIYNLKKIIQEDVVSIKILRQIFLLLKKWEEEVNENFLKLLEEGEEIIYAIEKNTVIGPVLEEVTEPTISQKFSKLPNNLKTSIIKQVLDEYPQGFPLILELVKNETDLDEKIITMLAIKATGEVGDLFGKILVETKDKNLRRLLKKYLFQMKSKGLEVTIPKGEDEEPLKFQKIESAKTNAYATGIDYLGERLVFLNKSVLGWGVVFFQITLSDQEGLKNFSAFDLNRKEIKDFLKRISEDKVIKLTEISSEYCYYLIDEAYQINLKKGITLPEQFSHWKAELDELKGEVSEPLIYSYISREALDEGTLRTLRDKYDTLLEIEEFKGWFLEPRLIWDYIEKYKEIESSPLVLNPYQIEERKKSIFVEAAQKIFQDDLRKAFQRRLEEMAYILFLTNKEDSAKLACSAAFDLSPEGMPSEKHGFLQRLIQKSILFYSEEKNTRQEDRSIIVLR